MQAELLLKSIWYDSWLLAIILVYTWFKRKYCRNKTNFCIELHWLVWGPLSYTLLQARPLVCNEASKHTTPDQILISSIVYTKACSAYHRSHIIKCVDYVLIVDEFNQHEKSWDSDNFFWANADVILKIIIIISLVCTHVFCQVFDICCKR